MTVVPLTATHAGACFTPHGCLMAGLDTFWGSLADGIRQAAGEAVTTLFSWWAGTGSTPVDTAVVHTAQRFATAWIAVPVAVLAVLAVITWTVGTGSPAWIRDLARGLLVFGVTATGSIPIVAAGQFSRGSLLWLPKVTGWLLAFLTFKPTAALIYYVGFSLVSRSSDVSTVVSGICVMIAAVLAMPALLRLVTFAVSSPNPSGSVLSGLATTTGIAASLAQVAGRRGAPAGAASAGAAVPATAAVNATATASSTVSNAVAPKGSTP